MKYAVIVLALSVLSFAKDAHVTSRTVKYAATLSPVKAVKDSAKGSFFLVKKSAEGSYFVVRHPVKDARGVYKVGKFVF